MQASIARLSALTLAAMLAVVAGGGFMLYAIGVEREQTRSLEAPSYAPRLLATEITSITQQLDAATQAIARSPLTLRILKATNEAERTEWTAMLVSLHPNLGTIQVLTTAQAAGQAPIPVTLVSQQKHLIEKAGTTDHAALRARPTTLTLSEPVRDASGATIGYVLIEHELKSIRNLFATTPLISGYAELQQINGTSDVLLKRGNEQLRARPPAQTLAVEGTPWRLVVWNTPPASALGSMQANVYLVIGATLGLILIALGWLFYRAINRQLQDDLTALTRMLSDVTHNRLRKSYPIELKELRNSYQVMYQLGKLLVGKHLQIVNSAGTDHLSQVSNRRSFEAKQREIFQRVAEGWAHSLLIIDIDEFKRVNDTLGHDAGDQLIVQFGKALKENLRSSDFVARLGGDEFCVIFPNTPLKKASELAERLRGNLPAEVELLPGKMHRISWSGGLAEYGRQDQSENAALARADQALLDAKRAGRNRTQVKAA